MKSKELTSRIIVDTLNTVHGTKDVKGLYDTKDSELKAIAESFVYRNHLAPSTEQIVTRTDEELNEDPEYVEFLHDLMRRRDSAVRSRDSRLNRQRQKREEVAAAAFLRDQIMKEAELGWSGIDQLRNIAHVPSVIATNEVSADELLTVNFVLSQERGSGAINPEDLEMFVRDNKKLLSRNKEETFQEHYQRVVMYLKETDVGFDEERFDDRFNQMVTQKDGCRINENTNTNQIVQRVALPRFVRACMTGFEKLFGSKTKPVVEPYREHIRRYEKMNATGISR